MTILCQNGVTGRYSSSSIGVPKETWLSGRKRHRAKVLGGQLPRGFESHRLRRIINYKKSRDRRGDQSQSEYQKNL